MQNNAETQRLAEDASCSPTPCNGTTASMAMISKSDVRAAPAKWKTLKEVALEIEKRLSSIFLRDASGGRPCFGDDRRFIDDPHWRDFVLFHEFFHGETGRGLGASHQTGWTALVASLMEDAVQ